MPSTGYTNFFSPAAEGAGGGLASCAAAAAALSFSDDDEPVGGGEGEGACEKTFFTPSVDSKTPSASSPEPREEKNMNQQAKGGPSLRASSS